METEKIEVEKKKKKKKKKRERGISSNRSCLVKQHFNSKYLSELKLSTLVKIVQLSQPTNEVFIYNQQVWKK